MIMVNVTRTLNAFDLQEWCFWFDASRCTLYLDEYTDSTRQTKRHKYVITAAYRRIGRPVDGAQLVEKAAVPLPQDVVDAAKAKFFEHITVKKWDRA